MAIKQPSFGHSRPASSSKWAAQRHRIISWLSRVALLIILAVGAVLYVPFIQHEIVYMNHINWPFGDLSDPTKFGIAPGKARNVRITTADGEELGAWHILPRSVYTSLGDVPLIPTPNTSVYETALSERPTVLFFHGNAANRAVPYRVRIYTALANQLDCNVLAIDYRGFGDSTGSPTQHGLVLDAHAAFHHVAEHLHSAKHFEGRGIILAGHSLGTGVIAQLMSELSAAGRANEVRAGVLISPFTSLEDIMMGYWGVRCLQNTMLERKSAFLRTRLQTKFDSLSVLKDVTGIPILLAHAQNDWTIPIQHSRRLYESLVESRGHDPARVSTFSIPSWGQVNTSSPAGAAPVIYWEGRYGGHNDLGWTEAGIDLIASISEI